MYPVVVTGVALLKTMALKNWNRKVRHRERNLAVNEKQGISCSRTLQIRQRPAYGKPPALLNGSIVCFSRRAMRVANLSSPPKLDIHCAKFETDGQNSVQLGVRS